MLYIEFMYSYRYRINHFVRYAINALYIEISTCIINMPDSACLHVT